MFRRLLAALVLSLAILPAVSVRAQSASSEEGPWVVRAYYSDRAMIRKLAAWRAPWSLNRKDGYAIVNVDNAQEFEFLESLGFRVVIDAELTQKYYRAPKALLAPPAAGGIPGFSCYRTVEETHSALRRLRNLHPKLASRVRIGESWERTQNQTDGYALWVLKLTNKDISGPKPKVFIMSSLHAREYTPAELCLRFAEHLLSNYGVNADVTWLLDYHEIHLLLQANPDGRKKAEAGLLWRKNTDNEFCANTNNRGVDLNRNFAYHWNSCEDCSSGDPCSTVYRGPSKVSEPETGSIQAYLRSIFPDQRQDHASSPAPETATGVYLDVHSYASVVSWPWGFTLDPAPNGLALQTLGRKLAYFNGYFPEQDSEMYPTDGGSDDFAYGKLGVAAFTLELGTEFGSTTDTFFQDCASFEDTIVPANIPALLYAAKISRTPYITPGGPDATGLRVSRAGGAFTLRATIDATRYNNSNGAQPLEAVAGADLYIDVPPWAPSASPIALSAVDGEFSDVAEDALAVLGFDQIGPGRHILFVQGYNKSGVRGAVSAVFLRKEPALDFLAPLLRD